MQGGRPLDLGLEEEVDLNLCEHRLPRDNKNFVLLQHFFPRAKQLLDTSTTLFTQSIFLNLLSFIFLLTFT